MEFLTVNKVIKLLRENNIEIKKHLGQNFLIDRNSRDKMLSFADIGHGDTVVEVGPGLGALTEILVEKAGQVCVFEIDPRLIEFLSGRFGSFENFHIAGGDFLEVSENWWSNFGKKVKLISNTPYYMSSRMAFEVVSNRSYISMALLTVQKEVGEKMVSCPGTKNYGPISVLNHIYTETKICYSLKKDVFFPRPEVESVVVKVAPLAEPKIHIREERIFPVFLSKVFLYRRKKLPNVVNNVFGMDKKLFAKEAEKEGILQKCRAEDLSPGQLCRVFDILCRTENNIMGLK